MVGSDRGMYTRAMCVFVRVSCSVNNEKQVGILWPGIVHRAVQYYWFTGTVFER